VTNELQRDPRPQTSHEKESFSSGGKRWLLLLRGPTGLAIDKRILWLTGCSLITKQYAVAGGMAYQPTLLFTTTGARTGRKRTAALPYFEVDDTWVLRGSNGGGATDPHWVHNVRACPRARVRIGWKSVPVQAHVAEGAERALLFDRLDAMSPSTGAYQRMCAPRELPLVVLRRA
jgi:deazaflavin-dependent oxidoreductase (nitroreductase family)